MIWFASSFIIFLYNQRNFQSIITTYFRKRTMGIFQQNYWTWWTGIYSPRDFLMKNDKRYFIPIWLFNKNIHHGCRTSLSLYFYNSNDIVATWHQIIVITSLRLATWLWLSIGLWIATVVEELLDRNHYKINDIYWLKSVGKSLKTVTKDLLGYSFRRKKSH